MWTKEGLDKWLNVLKLNVLLDIKLRMGTKDGDSVYLGDTPLLSTM